MDDLTAYRAIKAHFEQPKAVLCKDDQGDCFYRYPYDGYGDQMAGSKCAFGCLIPDDVYEALSENESIEGVAAVTVIESIIDRNLAPGLFDDVNKDFIEAAQFAHDNAQTVQDFLNALDTQAKNYGLCPAS